MPFSDVGGIGAIFPASVWGSMSKMGREIFNEYVANYLNHPDLAPLPFTSHVQNLISLARGARIPTSEITEEVGPLLKALADSRGAAKKAGAG